MLTLVRFAVGSMIVASTLLPKKLKGGTRAPPLYVVRVALCVYNSDLKNYILTSVLNL